MEITIPWFIIGLALMLGALALGQKAQNEMPRLNIKQLLTSYFAWWSGFMLINWAALNAFLKLFA